jgi:hypothetical protein
MRNQVSHSYKTADKTEVSYNFVFRFFDREGENKLF